jgi:FAD/FMN-containing dehydrogenase
MSRPVSRRTFLDTGVLAPLAVGIGTHLDRAALAQGPTLDTCDDDETFHNWARTISCKPSRYCQPKSTDEVVAIVKEAAQAGKHVRVVGAGHSWSPLVLTRDVLVNLDELDQVTVDTARKTATIGAGIRLKRLIPALADKGLGMANLGSILEQSIAGATATGTHGTGLGIGILSTQIIGMKIVAGTGDVVTVDGSNADLLAAGRVSLGALGIVTEVTLQCVPDYKLEYTAYWCKFDDVVPRIDTLVRENTRVRLWWLVPSIGPKDGCVLSTMNPPGTAPGIMERAESLSTGPAQPLEAAPLPMDADGLAATALVAAGRPDCSRLLKFTDRYEKVLNVPLLPVLHRECEYAIPVATAGDALRALRRAVDEGGFTMKLPVEVRFAAKDDCLLSPARGRDVCYIGISTQDNANEVFERFEPIMRRLGGRPHWGKCYSLTQKDVAAMYPDSYEKFRTLRKQLDPKGVFTNELMQQLFD